jgi:hypothetical protein
LHVLKQEYHVLCEKELVFDRGGTQTNKILHPGLNVLQACDIASLGQSRTKNIANFPNKLSMAADKSGFVITIKLMFGLTLNPGSTVGITLRLGWRGLILLAK